MKHKGLFLFVVMFSLLIQAKGRPDEKHIEVVMRQIGHELLLASGDSNSVVLPIVHNQNEYTIQFESDLDFDTDTLVALVKFAMREAEISDRYIVEVLACDSGQVVYSFEVGQLRRDEIIPCRGRENAKACYNIVVTLLPETDPTPIGETAEREHSNLALGLWVSIVLAFGFGASRLFKKKEEGSSQSENELRIGSFVFDPKNMSLYHEENQIELTSKESDLLFMLFQSVNETLERDVLLHQVWQDEGAYIGRTLDVFISKLRKKLEADPKVKIVNIRGVGYKLIINN